MSSYTDKCDERRITHQLLLRNLATLEKEEKEKIGTEWMTLRDTKIATISKHIDDKVFNEDLHLEL